MSQVWQGLADHDPDVDAIYRLTQRRRNFDFTARGAPLALPVGTFCPYNAQARPNTDQTRKYSYRTRPL